MSMKKYMMLFACTAGALMWSCGNDHNEESTDNLVEVVSASSFSYVSEVTTGIGRVYDGPTYRITFNDDKRTAKVEMQNVKYADGQTAASYVFSDVPFIVDRSNNARVIDVSRITPDKASSPVVTDLDIVVLPEKEIDMNGDATKPVAMDGVAVSYEVDGKYEVTNIPYRMVFEGTTTTTKNTDQSTFVSTKTTYVVDIDKKDMKGVLKINSPSFAANMPTLGTMEFAGLDVTLEDGGYILTCAQLIPTIAGTPYPPYVISNLKMTVELDGESELRFNCMKDKTGADVFTVDVNCPAAYTPSK